MYIIFTSHQMLFKLVTIESEGKESFRVFSLKRVYNKCLPEAGAGGSYLPATAMTRQRDS